MIEISILFYKFVYYAKILCNLHYVNRATFTAAKPQNIQDIVVPFAA